MGRMEEAIITTQFGWKAEIPVLSALLSPKTEGRKLR